MNRELHICTPIFRDIYHHPLVNEIHCVGYTFLTGDTVVISISSKDAPTFPYPTPTAYTFTTSAHLGGHDLYLLAYLHGVEFAAIKEYYTRHVHSTYALFDNVRGTHRLIPITIWTTIIHKFHQQMLSLVDMHSRDVATPVFQKLTAAFNALRSIEASGLSIDMEELSTYYDSRALRGVKNDMVYTQYNPYTMTGRPSNRFNGINFAAVPKDTGARKSFISRFTNGTLVQFDFDAYHLRLLGKYANVTLPPTPLHEYLGSLYFNKSSLTAAEYDEAKQRTFHTLYGDNIHTDIELLSRIKDVAASVYAEYLTHGYMVSPLVNRKMYIDSAHTSKHKLFNYFVQALEFEYTSTILQSILTYLEPYASRCILYTYDAILLDTHPEERELIVPAVQKLLEHDNFPVKIYMGKNYHDIEKCSLVNNRG
jgi:hypothetical protein